MNWVILGSNQLFYGFFSLFPIPLPGNGVEWQGFHVYGLRGLKYGSTFLSVASVAYLPVHLFDLVCHIHI